MGKIVRSLAASSVRFYLTCVHRALVVYFFLSYQRLAKKGFGNRLAHFLLTHLLREEWKWPKSHMYLQMKMRTFFVRGEPLIYTLTFGSNRFHTQPKRCWVGKIAFCHIETIAPNRIPIRKSTNQFDDSECAKQNDFEGNAQMWQHNQIEMRGSFGVCSAYFDLVFIITVFVAANAARTLHIVLLAFFSLSQNATNDMTKK